VISANTGDPGKVTAQPGDAVRTPEPGKKPTICLNVLNGMAARFGHPNTALARGGSQQPADIMTA